MMRWTVLACFAAAFAVIAPARSESPSLRLKAARADLLVGEPAYLLVTAAGEARVLPASADGDLRFVLDRPQSERKRPAAASATLPSPAEYDLLESYSLTQPGEYTVRAVLKTPAGTLESNPVTLRIDAPSTSDDKAALDRLHHFPWSNYVADKFCGDTFDLVAKWPDSRYAPYARYFCGRYLQTHDDLDGAIAAYRALIEKHPSMALADDAAYQIAATLRAQKKDAESRAQLEKVRRDYPNTNAARLAAE
jgi:hypothetical protein